MLRVGRGATILIGLVVLGLLACSCGTLATPTANATPTGTATQQLAQPATVTNTPVPTRSPIEAVPSSGTPTWTPARTATPTPMPPTWTASCTCTPLPSSTPTPIPTCTPLPPTATPTPTLTPPPPPPTATPAPSPLPATITPHAYRFLPAGPAQPDPSHPCPGCPKAPAYIVGHVADAGGNPLAGVRLVCYNEWYRYPAVSSKAGGEYDFAIIQAETTWYVVVLDQADVPISPEVAILFAPHETCRYILDWRRVH